jgi:hypothetical protein
LVTTNNAGRTWTVRQLPRRIDSRWGETLTVQPDSRALMINHFDAATPGGPWHKLRLHTRR